MKATPCEWASSMLRAPPMAGVLAASFARLACPQDMASSPHKTILSRRSGRLHLFDDSTVATGIKIGLLSSVAFPR